MFLSGMLVGAIIGAIISLFVAGAGKNNRELDAYQEGFIDGYNRRGRE